MIKSGLTFSRPLRGEWNLTLSQYSIILLTFRTNMITMSIYGIIALTQGYFILLFIFYRMIVIPGYDPFYAS